MAKAKGTVASTGGNVPPAFATLRFKACQERPYFSAVLFSLIPIPSEDVPTLGVDEHWRMYYNEKLLETMPVEEAVGVLYHEIGHLLRDHHDRVGDREKQIWNMAGDLCINQDLREEGVKLPDWVLYPEKYKLKKGLTTEEYYEELMKRAKLQEIKMMGAGSGNCGNCSGGGKKPWESEGPAGGADKDDPLHQKVDKLSQELAKRAVAKDIVEHSASRGTVPDSLLRWAKEKIQPVVNWKKILRSKISNTINFVSGIVDYTRARPARRQSAYGRVLMYGFHSPVPKIGVIIDTSGSMGDEDLGKAVAEVGSILKTAKADITVLSCDAAVSNTQKIKSMSQIKLSGGGGTDMPEGFKACEELKPQPDIVICITDGYTPWPPNNVYKFKTIAVLTQKGSYDQVPSWIQKIGAFEGRVGEEK